MAVLTVGSSDQQFTTLTAAVAAARPGDTIQVQADTHVNDFPGYVNGLTIEGVGGIANFVATHQPPNGKAIIDEGGNTTLKNLSFSGVTVPDGNGAGVRYENGNLVIENSTFTGNQDGLLGNVDPNGTITISNSEFDANGGGTGNTHNIYIGDIAQFTITDSYIHGANAGHEIKSRAESNTITDNRILDNNSTSSYSIDLPNGGDATISGNVIEQGPNGANGNIIAYGEEGGSSTLSGTKHTGTAVSFTNNTVVNDRSGYDQLFNSYGGTITASGNTTYGIATSALGTGVPASGFTALSSRPTISTSSGDYGTVAPSPTLTPIPTSAPTPTPTPVTPSAGTIALDDTTLGQSVAPPTDTSYSGPVSYLQYQVIWNSPDGVAASASMPNVFLKGNTGNDALQVSSGSNVLDGGAGSNFLVGATGSDGGHDTFFVDGRDARQVTWDTLVNFHPGDAVTLWGFNAASTMAVSSSTEGAAAYQGATIHAETGGAGTGVNASITFAGVTQAQLAGFAISQGAVGGESYLYIARA